MTKYADGPTIAESIEIDAPPAAVWPVVSDIATPARFSDELQKVEWKEGFDGPAVGALFYGHNKLGDFEWKTMCEITDCTEPERFEWKVLAGPDVPEVSVWRFEVAPTDAGGSRVTQWARMGPGPSGITYQIDQEPDREEEIVERRLGMWSGYMRANLDGIKAQLES